MTKVACAWTLLFGLALTACSKDAPPVAEQPRSPAFVPREEARAPAAPLVEAAPAAEAPPAAAKFVEDGFELSLTPTAPLKAGEKGELTLRLTAKEPYHVNDKYPYKLEWKPAEGIQFDANPAPASVFTVENMTVTGKLGITPSAKGKTQVSGVFKFSVCTDDKCLIEKRELSLALDVN